jgi:hypothetical protein
MKELLIDFLAVFVVAELSCRGALRFIDWLVKDR